jgi:DnaJ family protein C protein 28
VDDWQSAIEDQIKKLMDEGAFDDLPGKGKPIRWDDNPYADPDSQAAHHLLKNAGYTLPWIEERQQIDADLDAARRALIRSRRWVAAQDRALYPDAEDEWQRAVARFREAAVALNRRIRDYNLKVPSDAFQRLMINAEREIEIIEQNAG